MANEIISYLEVCQREGVNLQKGTNYQLGNGYSVILMSVHDNAPYRDYFEDNGSTLIYEGHDIQRRDGIPDPKSIDQPEFNPTGALTENGNGGEEKSNSHLRQTRGMEKGWRQASNLWSHR